MEAVAAVAAATLINNHHHPSSPIMMVTSTGVDCNANSGSTLNLNLNHAELEVVKLQALIRRLERQNEQLRTARTNGCCGSPHRLAPSPVGGGGCCLPTTTTLSSVAVPQPPPALLLRCQSPSSSLRPPSAELLFSSSFYTSDGGGSEEEEDSVLDGVELLDLGSVSPSSDEDAETWLYVSSKARRRVDSLLTPVQWCRMVLDVPKSQVEVARRSLSLKLDQVSRWRSMFSSPAAASPFNGVPGVPPLSSSPLARACSTPQLSERHAPALSSPVHPILQRAVSPMGRESAVLSDRTPTFFPHLGNRNRSLQRSASSPQSSNQDGGERLALGVASMMTEDDDDQLLLQGYKLNDLTDVQVMARLQEESLRQDYASSSSSMAASSPLLPPRRSRSLSLHLSGLSAAVPGLDEVSDEEEEEEDYALLPPPQPRLVRLSHSHTFSSLRDSSLRDLSHSHTFSSSSLRDWPRSTSSLLCATPPSSSTTTTPPCPSAGWATQHQHHHAALGMDLGMAGMSGLGMAGMSGLGMAGLGMASSYAADLQQSFRTGSDKLRRSMPNLVKASMTCVPSISANHVSPTTTTTTSPSLLRNSQSFDSSSGLARLQQSSIPSPGQLQNRVQSVGNFVPLSRQPLKATAYVSPTVKGGSAPSMWTSTTSLQSLTNTSTTTGGGCGGFGAGGVGGFGSGIPLLGKVAGSGTTTPTSNPASAAAAATPPPPPPRSSGLPRPASFIGATTSSTPSRSKLSQPARSLLTPPKSLSTFSALRDTSWRDGCY